MDIANNLNRLIRDGMTQKAIADEIGCSQSTISDLSNGKIGNVRPSYKIVAGLMRLVDERFPKLERKSSAKK